MSQDNEYGAGQIQVLEGLEAVRKRPAMYIGSTDSRGLHHLIHEVVGSFIDEALAGHCDAIEIVSHEDDSVSATDNDRGTPVDTHEQCDRSALGAIITVLHAGGKLDNKSYQVSGDFHGVDVSVVNALSSELEVEVKHDGAVWTYRFEVGEPQVEELERVCGLEPGEGTGTTIRFWPDSGIFEATEFDFKTLGNRLWELTFLNSRVEISLSDGQTNESSTFLFEGDTRGFVGYFNEIKMALHGDVIYYDGGSEGIEVEIAIQATDELQGLIHAFASSISAHEDGTHLIGSKMALTRVVNDYANTHDTLDDPNGDNLHGEDVHEGLAAVISVKYPDPQSEGQMKTKLDSFEVRGIVESIIYQQLRTFFEENLDTATAIISKAIGVARTRKVAKQAEEFTRHKSAFEPTSLPGKLADCQSRDPAGSELLIVEGDSVGGSTKQDHDRKFQAILPLKGRILNVEKHRLDCILENGEIRAFVAVIGSGVDDEFGIEEVHHQRLILMTDVNVDGAHIRTLLLTPLYHHVRPLIGAGYVYAAQPPLHCVRYRSSTCDTMDEAERDRVIEEEYNGDPTQVQRFRGLGEMSPDQLWDTTMSLENRVLKCITIEDAVAADRMLNILMGGTVRPRKQFIRGHANDAEWVGI